MLMPPITGFSGGPPEPCPFQVFKVPAGWVIVACGNPSLANNERFATNPQRVRNRDALLALLAVNGCNGYAGSSQMAVRTYPHGQDFMLTCYWVVSKV